MPFVEREQPRSDPYSRFWCEVVHQNFLAALRGEEKAQKWFKYSPMWETVSTALFSKTERELILQKATSATKYKPPVPQRQSRIERPATLKSGRPIVSDDPRNVYERERRWKKIARQCAAMESANAL